MYVDQTLVTDSNEQTPQSVRLLNQAAAHLKTAVKYCLCARRTAGWLAGVKKVLQSTSSMEILRGFRQLLAVVLHVALYYTWLCITRGSVLHVALYDTWLCMTLGICSGILAPMRELRFSQLCC